MSICERIHIHTETEHGWISEDEFAQGMTRVRAAIEATEVDGGPVTYFEAMTAIGPMYTEDFDKAEKFETKQDAMNCPAFVHSLCFFEPYEI